MLPPSGGGEVDDRTFDTFLITASNRDQQNRQKENQNSSSSRHDEQERKLDLLIVIVLGIFATVGILVNALLMLAIKLEKRTLFLPWLVFHLITVMGRCLFPPSNSFKNRSFLSCAGERSLILINLFVFIKGCFAGGIYLALWFTILKQPDKTKPERWLAVLAVFPIVSRLTD